MGVSNFKNDNAANPSLVISQMLREAEKNIGSMTGKKVKLIVREKGALQR
jgi:hypothetical protein